MPSVYGSTHILTDQPLPVVFHEDNDGAVRFFVDFMGARQTVTLTGPHAMANLIAYRNSLDGYIQGRIERAWAEYEAARKALDEQEQAEEPLTLIAPDEPLPAARTGTDGD